MKAESNAEEQSGPPCSQHYIAVLLALGSGLSFLLLRSDNVILYHNSETSMSERLVGSGILVYHYYIHPSILVKIVSTAC